MFLSRNKKNNVYPCKPQFYYIKVGFKGSKLYRSIPVTVNNIMVGIESEICLFADDCVCYRQIYSIEDTSKLQKYIVQLSKWAREWGMSF